MFLLKTQIIFHWNETYKREDIIYSLGGKTDICVFPPHSALDDKKFTYMYTIYKQLNIHFVSYIFFFSNGK